jgi:hypothetical protein
MHPSPVVVHVYVVNAALHYSWEVNEESKSSQVGSLQVSLYQTHFFFRLLTQTLKPDVVKELHELTAALHEEAH